MTVSCNNDLETDIIINKGVQPERNRNYKGGFTVGDWEGIENVYAWPRGIAQWYSVFLA